MGYFICLDGHICHLTGDLPRTHTGQVNEFLLKMATQTIWCMSGSYAQFSCNQLRPILDEEREGSDIIALHSEHWLTRERCEGGPELLQINN